MIFGNLAASRHGPVQLIELTSDDGMNCYSPEMGEDLVAAFRAAQDDADIAAVVLTGRGRAFCAGAHRDVLTGRVGPSGLVIGSEHFITGFAAELAAFPKLTVAAFNGSAAGIGVTMTLPFDLRISVPGARLRLNFAELGIVPGLGSTALLPALVGRSAARKLLLCERMIEADDAHAIGLIDEVIAPDRLLARAIELGESAAACKGGTLPAIKRLLDADCDVTAALRREAAAAAALRGRG